MLRTGLWRRQRQRVRRRQRQHVPAARQQASLWSRRRRRRTATSASLRCARQCVPNNRDRNGSCKIGWPVPRRPYAGGLVLCKHVSRFQFATLICRENLAWTRRRARGDFRDRYQAPGTMCTVLWRRLEEDETDGRRGADGADTRHRVLEQRSVLTHEKSLLQGDSDTRRLVWKLPVIYSLQLPWTWTLT